MDVYQTFFAEEDSDAIHIERIRTTLGQDKKNLLLKMNFICDSSPKIQFLLTRLKGNKPFAPVVYSMIDGLSTNLSNGTAKTTFREQTDASLAELTDEERNDALDHFHNAYHRSFAKQSKHIDNSAAMDVLQKMQSV